MAASLNIAIDPGHGGSDSGAVYGRAKESEIALKVAQELKKQLDTDPNFSASITRDGDKNLSLQERVQFAEKARADLFLSIHANSSPDQRARGVEFYFQNHLPADEETLYLAAQENQMQKMNETAIESASDPTKKNDVLAIIEDLKRQHRIQSSHALSRTLFMAWQNSTDKIDSNVIRQAPFYVVSKTNVPSVLVELGFITNPHDSQKLINPDYQKEIARRIYQGLKNYKSNNADPILLSETR